MNTQLVPAEASAAADPPDFAKPGAIVQLVNVNSGLSVITVLYGAGRIQVPNPARALFVGGPREMANGMEVCDVRIANGQHRGKLVQCNPNVIRFMVKQVNPRRRRGWAWNPLKVFKSEQ